MNRFTFFEPFVFTPRLKIDKQKTSGALKLVFTLRPRGAQVRIDRSVDKSCGLRVSGRVGRSVG
jgi:hypothetical protein